MQFEALKKDHRDDRWSFFMEKITFHNKTDKIRRARFMRKKIVMLMLLACMITQNTVYADVLENQEHTTTDANTSVNVSANIFASFTVTLPKQIQIDTNKAASSRL